MMDPSEQNSFEEQWKRAFQEASETPPLSAWEGIEARLNEEEDEKVILLWWKTPKYWYAAASVAALLLVGIALWDGSYDGKNSPVENQVAVSKPEAAKEAEVLDESKREISPETKTDIQETIQAAPAIAQSGHGNAVSGKGSVSANRDEKIAGEEIALGEKQNPGVLSTEAPVTVPAFGKEEKSLLAARLKQPDEVSRLDNNKENTVAAVKLDAGSQILAEALMPLGYKDLDVYVQKRYVFFKPDALGESKTPKKDKKKQEYWADATMMPASFNPNINVTNAPSAYASANASRQSLSGTSRSGGSYALQTQGAKRISKHWSVETGLSYLQGNSTYEGGGYLLNAATSQASNVLQSAYADKSPAYSALPADPTVGFNGATNLYIDLNKEVRNDYRFIQVPVQAGFTLNPDKKLSYSLIGGMMANFFVNNELETASGSVVTTTGKDDVYRNLNYAATTGLRFNYKLSARLKATLSGSYQRSLLSGFKTSESLESHPSLYGVAWGVRYSF